MKEEPLITIVTVTFNIIESGRKDIFIQCLNSVHNQTYKNIEHIIIDGGSSDGTIDLIKKYSVDGWVRYISEKDNGIYNAMNKGLSLAKGKYITFLNSDDFYHNLDSVKMSVNLLEENNADFSYADYLKKDSKGGGDIYSSSILENFIYRMPFNHQTMFTKTSILKKEGGFNEKYKIASDYDLIIRLIMRDYKNVYLNKDIVSFDINGISSKQDYSEEIISIYRNNFGEIVSSLSDEQIKDIKYKMKIPFGFPDKIKSFLESKKLKNIKLDRVYNIASSMSYIQPDKNIESLEYFEKANELLCSGEYLEAEKNIKKYKDFIDYNSFYKIDNRINKNPKVSIIIVSYNTKEKLLECVNSVFLKNNKEDFEIIVVDNGGNDEIFGKLIENRILYIKSPVNFKPSEGRNIGVKFSNAPIVAFLDDDALVGDDYVLSIFNKFNSNNIIGLRGKILPKTDNINNNFASHYDLGEDDKYIDYINSEGVCAFLKSKYEEINGMNPLLFGHEGIEISYRIKNIFGESKILYSPNIMIYHDFANNDIKLKTKNERHEIMKKYLYYSFPLIDFFIKKEKIVEIKFSIIMPTYNRKHCIKDAIDSLFTQTYQNFELIIIDDGSKDETEKYIKEIYEKEVEQEKIRYIKLAENIGASDARNEGLKIAKNEWVGYLDSDNKMHLNFLETYAKNILENKEYKIFYAKIKHRNSGIILGHEFIKEELEAGNFIDMGVFVHHVDLFKELGGFDPEIKRLDDWYLILKYTAIYKPFFIDKVLLDYYDGKDFSRTTLDETHDDNYKRAFLGYLESLPDDIFIKNNYEKYERFKIIKEKELILKNQEEKINKNELELKNKDEIISQKDIQLNAILNSTIWKITKPMRKISDKIKRLIALIKYSLVVLKNEGIFSLIKRTLRFFYKRLKGRFTFILNFLNNKKRLYKILIRKSITAYKKDGLFFLLNKIIFYLKNKKDINDSNTLLFSKKEVAFISGAPGASMRYRCFYQAEQLKNNKINSDIFVFSEDMDLVKMLPFYNIFILHRVPFTNKIKNGIEIGKDNNKIFIFDSDDLIFDKKYASFIRAMDYIPKYEADLYKEGLVRYGRTMSLCDYCIASTEKIKLEMEKHNKISFISQNSIGDEMYSLSNINKDFKIKKSKKIILGYMSGTNTHNFDFKEASNAIYKLMKKYNNLALLIVGPLKLEKKFNELKKRIIKKDFVSWKKLPKLIASIDINLAPLEKNNDFCEAKSDLKYFEAALVSIPTVASSTWSYKKNIVDGFNGLLCDDEKEWEFKIEFLINNNKKRLEIGRNAYNDVVKNRNTKVAGENLFKIINNIYSLQKKKKIINWILQDPIKGSGGYTTIFKMAKFVTEKGYTCNMYISKTEHLSSLSNDEVISFVKNNFEVSNLNFFIGWNNFIDSDITFATAWSTADFVYNLKDIKNKSYFVQDYEPWFFEVNSENFDLAKRTYSLGLNIVSIGSYLSKKIKKEFNYKKTYFFDFYSDKNVYFVEPKKNNKKIRIIFYARPSTKRRGFSLGIDALSMVYKKYKDNVEIVLYGDNNLGSYNIDFPFINLGIISNKELAEQFSMSHIGISFSFTNMSLVPLDMMSCRCAVVELDSETIMYDLVNEFNCLLAKNDPSSVSEKISFLIDNPNKRDEIINNAYKFVSERSKEKSTTQFIDAIEDIINKN